MELERCWPVLFYICSFIILILLSLFIFTILTIQTYILAICLSSMLARLCESPSSLQPVHLKFFDTWRNGNILSQRDSPEHSILWHHRDSRLPCS